MSTKHPLAIVLALCCAWSQAAGAATHVVRAEGVVFIPSSLDIVQGDTVVWTNTSVGMDHTSTSGTPPTGSGLWDGYMTTGQSFSYTFSAAGDFPYFCDIHDAAGMTGVVHVAGNVWSGATELGGGWYSLSWFGAFYRSNTPWIYHAQLEWLYVVGTNVGSLWLYSPAFGWVWTSQPNYPFLYSAQWGAWLYYLHGSQNPRWFYNFGSGQWENQ